MPWANPNSPNLPDFYLFVQNQLQVPILALPSQTVAAPTAAPTLTGGAGGALPAGTIYVRVTYVSAFGETQASPEASVTVAANGSVSVASPPLVAFATGYNVYAALATGGEVFQSGPVAIGTPFVLTAMGTSNATPPTINTTGWTWPYYAFQRALNLVFFVPTVAGLDYTLAVYNCAAHILIGIAPDTLVTYQNNMGFFAYSRDQFNLNEASSGVIATSSDESTSNAMAVPDSLKNLTASDLNFFRTPWGRYFLGYGQDFGAAAGLS